MSVLQFFEENRARDLFVRMEFNNFVAEDQLIEIIPKFNYPKELNLLCGKFGKFEQFVSNRQLTRQLLNGDQSS